MLLVVINSRSVAPPVSPFLNSSVFHVRVSEGVPECLGVPVLVLNFVSPSAPLPAVPGSVTKSRPLLLVHHKTSIPVHKEGIRGAAVFHEAKIPFVCDSSRKGLPNPFCTIICSANICRYLS